jgi:hypothetical protein
MHKDQVAVELICLLEFSGKFQWHRYEWWLIKFGMAVCPLHLQYADLTWGKIVLLPL